MSIIPTLIRRWSGAGWKAGAVAMIVAATILVGGGADAASDVSPVAVRASVLVDVTPAKVAIAAYSGVGDRETWAILGRGADGQVWWRSVTPETAQPESEWRAVPGQIASGPDAVAVDVGTLLIAARSTSGNVVIRQITATSNGSGWTSLGGTITTAPALALAEDGTLGVFARGGDNALWYRLRPYGLPWGPWLSLGGRFTSAIDASITGYESFSLCGRGTDGAVWSEALSTGGVRSDGWRRSRILTTSGVASMIIDDAMGAMYYRDSSGQLMEEINGSVPRGGALTSAPDVVPVYGDTVGAVLVRGTDNAAWLWNGNWHRLGGQLR